MDRRIVQDCKGEGDTLAVEFVQSQFSFFGGRENER